MSELTKFLAKPIEKEIDGANWIFTPLNGEDLNFFLELTNPNSAEDQSKAIMKLITRYIRDNIPDATDEEIKNLPIKFLNKLILIIYEVNGVDVTKLQNVPA